MYGVEVGGEEQWRGIMHDGHHGVQVVEFQVGASDPTDVNDPNGGTKQPQQSRVFSNPPFLLDELLVQVSACFISILQITDLLRSPS